MITFLPLPSIKFNNNLSHSIHLISSSQHDSGTDIPMSSLDNAATNSQDLSCHGDDGCPSSECDTSLDQELPHNLSTSPLLSTASSHNTGVHSNIGEAENSSCDRVPLPQNLPHHRPVATSGVDISSNLGGSSPPPHADKRVADSAPSASSKEPFRLKHTSGKVLAQHRSPSNTNHDTIGGEDIWERRCTVTPDAKISISTETSPSSSSSPSPSLRSSPLSITTSSATPPSSWVRDNNTGPRSTSPKSSTCNGDAIPDYLQRRATENTTGRGPKTCTV